ncbi:MAG: AraC-like DNA-binding protein [Cyclobacteriaceae bacterium]|jgi:AraC-like DNA-binding protein
MEPLYQKVEIGSNVSFFMKDTFNPLFHFHSEYELILFREGPGKGIIGEKITSYQESSFFMLGPNLPHCFTNDNNYENKAYVIQINKDVLDNVIGNVPEYTSILLLIEKAKFGLKFNNKTGGQFYERFRQLFELESFDRWIGLLSILNELAQLTEVELLTSPETQLKVNLREYNRINIVYQHVFKSFRNSISLDDVSGLLSMTNIAFCRYFKKITRRTFITYLNEYRIGHACKLLTTTDKNVSEVAFESGFESIANFNKQFKKYTGTNPKKYKKNG